MEWLSSLLGIFAGWLITRWNFIVKEKLIFIITIDEAQTNADDMDFLINGYNYIFSGKHCGYRKF